VAGIRLLDRRIGGPAPCCSFYLLIYVTPKVIANRWVGGQVIFQPVKPKVEELAKPKNVPVRKSEALPPPSAEAPPRWEPPEKDFRPAGPHETAQPDMLSLGKDFAHSPQDQIKTVDLSQNTCGPFRPRRFQFFSSPAKTRRRTAATTRISRLKTRFPA